MILYYLLVVLHVIVCLFLIIVVLLQSGQSGDIAAAFGGMGSQTAFGPRGAATVLTKDPSHAQRAWRELDVGTVKINAVFGGAPGGAAEPARHSGLGFGYGPELLDELTRTKVVHLAVAP